MVGDVDDVSDANSKDLEGLDTGEIIRVRDFRPGRGPCCTDRLVATDGLESIVDGGESLRMGKATVRGGTLTRRFSMFRFFVRISIVCEDCPSPSCPEGSSVGAKIMLPELCERRRPKGTRPSMDHSSIMARVCDDETWSTEGFRVAGLLGGEYDRECDELAEVVEEESDGVSESLVLTSALDCLRGRTRHGK